MFFSKFSMCIESLCSLKSVRSMLDEEGVGALYTDSEAPLGVSDVGQVTISLSAVRG